MPIVLYQVDAFTDRLFAGNPAAVCPLDAWLSDENLQAIAAENNLSETAFVVDEPSGLRIRWFTPTTEIRLCGHATLAAAWVWLNHCIEGPSPDSLTFQSPSGPLTVAREADGSLTLDFPCEAFEPVAAPEALVRGLGGDIWEVVAGQDWLVRLSDEAAVRAASPIMDELCRLDRRGVILTAEGTEADFVSRFFAPRFGIDEDPVTGSAHCLLTPFWAERLGRTRLSARQLSARGGELTCELAGDRVRIGGRVGPFLEGTLARSASAGL